MFDTKKLEGIKINLKSLKLEIVFCNAKNSHRDSKVLKV